MSMPKVLIDTDPGEVGPVRVRFRIATAGTAVRLEVFDVGGRRVRTLDEGVLAAGDYERRWNRDDDRGGLVARGLYLVRLRAGEVHLTRKAVLLGE